MYTLRTIFFLLYSCCWQQLLNGTQLHRLACLPSIFNDFCPLTENPDMRSLLRPLQRIRKSNRFVSLRSFSAQTQIQPELKALPICSQCVFFPFAPHMYMCFTPNLFRLVECMKCNVFHGAPVLAFAHQRKVLRGKIHSCHCRENGAIPSLSS